MKNYSELRAQVAGVTAIVVLIPTGGQMDEAVATSLGIAIELDKPIIGLVQPGARVSEKLAAIIDRFVEFNPRCPDKARTAVTAAAWELTQRP